MRPRPEGILPAGDGGAASAASAAGLPAPLGAAALARLLVWFSPAFPIGAFGFSGGLEWAAEAGDVTDRASLEAWIAALLAHGGGWSDAVLLAHAHRGVARGGGRRLRQAAELAVALQPSRERRLESTAQGEAFARAVLTMGPNPGLGMLRAVHAGPLALGVAAGAAAAGAGLPLAATLTASLTAFAGNLVSAAIRLAPIGQSDGLRTLAALEPVIAAAAARATGARLREAGGMAWRADVASMRHETQGTRLFRS